MKLLSELLLWHFGAWGVFVSVTGIWATGALEALAVAFLVEDAGAEILDCFANFGELFGGFLVLLLEDILAEGYFFIFTVWSAIFGV